MIGSKTSESG